MSSADRWNSLCKELLEVMRASAAIGKHRIAPNELDNKTPDEILEVLPHVNLIISILIGVITIGEGDSYDLFKIGDQIDALERIIECLEEDLKGDPMGNEDRIERAIDTAETLLDCAKHAEETEKREDMLDILWEVAEEECLVEEDMTENEKTVHDDIEMAIERKVNEEKDPQCNIWKTILSISAVGLLAYFIVKH